MAIRTSFFDDDAESLGKKRLVVDDETKSDLRLPCRSVRFVLHKISLFLPTLFVAPFNVSLSFTLGNVVSMRPQKQIIMVRRLGERWTFRIDHGQSHVHVRHVVFIMSCIHIQRNDSECQTFRSEVCRLPFEYGDRIINAIDSWCADETATSDTTRPRVSLTAYFTGLPA